MSIRRIIREKVIEKLPKRMQLLIERQYYAPHMKNEIEIMKKYCGERKNSLDIGANKGDWTLFLSRYSSHVYCFEPIPKLCDYLKNRFYNCNVTIENYALGNIDGSLCLNIPYIRNRALETRSSVVSNFNNEVIMGEKISKVDKIEVLVRRLDDLDISNIGFIKIDVEGFESQVIEGGKETIRKNMPNMMIEIEQRNHKKDKISSIFKLVENMGYRGYFLYRNKILDISRFNVSAMQEQVDDKSKDYVNNFIFLPR